jgi:sulfur-carrier protein
MKVELSLFGAFRSFGPTASIALELEPDAQVGALRAALAVYAQSNWPDFSPGLLACSVFASASSVLRESDVIPEDRRLAILPPVSGG